MTFLKKAMVALAATFTMAVAGGDVAPISEPTVIIEVVEAESNFYAGVNAQAVLGDRLDYLGLDIFDDADYGVGVQAGYTFLRSGNFSTAVEARYTYSWSDRTLGDTGILSGFVKPAYDFGPVSAYALVGYSEVDISGSVNGTNIGSSDGFAWGLGLAGDVADNLELFVDYTVNPGFDTGFDIADFDNEVVTVGINYLF